jgi:hypothetical protein
MKSSLKPLLVTLILFNLLIQGTQVSGVAAEVTSVEDIIELEKTTTPKVQLTGPTKEVDSTLKGQIERTENLQPEDAQNLSALWKTVIERNPIIQYGLKQLATPPELRYAHTGLMKRTINGLLSGAALVPYMMGADQYTAGATSLGVGMVDRAIQQTDKIDPSQLPSDTELVELSGFVQQLQRRVIENYFDYKNNLERCTHLQQQQEKLNQQYQNAVASSDPLDDLWTKHQITTTSDQLFQTRQAAKRHYLILERLVGTDGMRNLRFGEMQPPSDSGKISSIPESSPQNP